MREITEQSVNCFYNKQEFNKGNTSVTVFDYNSNELPTDAEVHLNLHGNNIAKTIKNRLFISNAGYKTNTTKERLNALKGVNICQKKGVWYLNGKEWDGNWIEIK